MINPLCPSDLEANEKFVAKVKYKNQCKFNNSVFDSIEEKRLDRYYTEIIRRKLLQLKYIHERNIRILDICGGSGFLTYHIYKIFGRENNYYLIDISKNEVNRAKLILGNKVKFQVDDFLSYIPKTKYDLIIGNSFLHHFPDVPFAINKIYRLLNRGGYFIDLHEPSEKAAFVESIGRDNIIGDTMETVRMFGIRERGQGAIGTDLWMFNYNDLKELLEKAKFKEIYIYKSGFLRTILENLFKCSNRNVINQIIRTLLNISYGIDTNILNNYCFSLFNSYFFIAKRR
jgi:ubiquinone/menaquinone biosynthesis C-methylase UbiE